MADRGADGRFVKGNPGGPGRPPKEREEKYYEILLNTVTFADWKEIIQKAAAQAKKGDATARKWLSDYIVGAPVQRVEQTGKDGDALRVIIEYARDTD